MHTNRSAFTLVELIVVITILAILGTIGYISLLGYNVIARDTVRKTDITNIAKVVELSRLEDRSYPQVSNIVNVSFSGSTIWKQGSFGQESHIDARRISEIPTDPLTGSEYAYSVTLGTGEYQVGAIIERAGSISLAPNPVTQSYAADFLPTFATTFIRGNYNGKFITHTEHIDQDTKNIYILGVPSILSNKIGDVDLRQIHASNSFVYPGGGTAPATYSGSVTPGAIWESDIADVTGDITVIYEGTNQDLSTDDGKIEFVNNLQTYYAGSDVADSSDFDNIETLNPTEDPDSALAFVNTYLNVGEGGLSGETLAIETSSISSTAAGPLQCMDMTQQHVDGINESLAWDNDTGAYGSATGPENAYYDTYSDLPFSKEKICNIVEISYNTAVSFPPGLVYLHELESVGFGILPSEDVNVLQDIGNMVSLESLSFWSEELINIEYIADLKNLQQLSMQVYSGDLGSLDGFFDQNSLQTCQDNIPASGKRMCVEGNGTTIDITITNM